ncbi:Ldh family oxidoreductase [Aminobacter sp. P9b]|uniref:Ldh family oxidoreductase n=1 Tax=Aminobacter sp. P9b TaxID=3133697 RepID=UPI00324BFEA6
MTNNINMTIESASKLVIDCFVRNGCSPAVAKSVARVIVAAEADGCLSHGLFRVPGYVASLRSGKVSGVAQPKVRQALPGVIVVDGQGGFAPPALDEARSSLIELTRGNGIAGLALVNVHHFSALWTDLEPICAEGLCSLAFTSYLPVVAPAGGTKPLFGTNPMAFGWPRADGRPMVFDQASSVLARGEVMIAARDSHRMPEGVGIDANGNPSTDPNEILKGAMLTFGGYKGSAIALMVELLAGSLIGEQFSYQAGENDNKDGGPPRGGELIIAMNPVAIGGVGAFAHAEQLFSKITEQPGARLPADRRYANRVRATESGLSLPAEVVEQVRALMI